METKLATDIFDVWAINGKDKGMEKGHSKSVDRMIQIAIEKIPINQDRISIADIGCGNGWMLRKILSISSKFRGLGIDGAKNMIENAKKIDPEGNYLHADLESWNSTEKFDLVISMEVIYYLRNPQIFLSSVFNNCLNKNSNFVIGIDHYKENKRSLSWPGDLNVYMHTLSISDWVNLFETIGFNNICYEQFDSRDDWAGTLIISGSK